MKITNNIEMIDLCLYIKKEKTLIISDIHLGFEESLNQQGILLPRFQFKETMERLEKIISKLEIKKIIINGDLKHEFGNISDTEWKNSLELMDYLKKDREIILIKGNHDKIIKPIAEKRNLKLYSYYRLNDIYICHGDFIPKDEDFKNSRIIIIGHEHPAVSIGTKIRKETYKCFLKGKYKDKDLIVMPSFNVITEGTNILKEKLLSPFLQQDLNNFEIYIVQDKIYDFGKIKDILKINS